ncbi:hypothetical protein CYG48_12845 [Neorhizobium sp. SOG26]|uniref:hypothetical protein n=1 Tax=Neorhizobium sp. SOG26 TaxID=2060726 RepID=UPI000E585807|nr:hypothetical protein [Neorhizobium sp. SOG26]AXV16497.1 hypothetical protein CYG48_12845 [Neorhizobium sp. SOG26]
MNTKTSFRRVTFQSPFLLPGMDKVHGPGEFDVQIVEEPLDVMWEGYHRTLTIMLTSGAFTEAVAVTEAALDEALARDQEQSRSSL